MKNRILHKLLLLLLLAALLSGCAATKKLPKMPELPPFPHPTDTPVPTAKPDPTPRPTPTPEPTPTPTPCPHLSWENGVCADCGEPCLHVWEKGVCTVCALVCPHEEHDEDGRCLVCGEAALHRYRDGHCLICGREPDFVTASLPAEAFAPCDEPGRVETHDYRFNYGSGYELDRTMDIYLPFGYDPAKAYNVLVLLHGGNGSSHDFTVAEFPDEDQGFTFTMKALYDRMIAEKRCEPLIIVSPYTCIHRDKEYPGYVPDVYFAKELREYILPYVAENYSTWAEGGTEEQLRAARDHFGIGGVSNGSLYAYETGMALCFDLFSQYICLSGSAAPWGVAECINSEAWRELPIRFYYAGCADEDWQHANSRIGFDVITESTERLTPGENSFYGELHGKHAWSQWAAHMYNALPLVFPPET